MVNVHEAKTTVSALIAEVKITGKTVFICRNGKPVADLMPHRRSDRRRPKPVMSAIKIHYDPTEALAPDEWPGAD